MHRRLTSPPPRRARGNIGCPHDPRTHRPTLGRLCGVTYLVTWDPSGLWTLDVLGGERDEQLVAVRTGADDSEAARVLSAAMLGHAFGTARARPELVDALVDGWLAEPPVDGCAIAADLLAGWALAWVLEHPASQ